MSYGETESYDSESVVSESVRFATPEVAMGYELGQTAAYGSTKARNRLKGLAWVFRVVIAIIILAILVNLLRMFGVY